MSMSVSGIGLGLVVAVLAAAPVRADETVGYTPPANSPPTTYGDTSVPPPAPTAPQGNTATNTQTATATGGAGGSAAGGDAGPSQGSSQGGDAYANGGRAESHNSVGSKQSNRPPDHALHR